MTKEYKKFMAAFEVVQALPAEFDRVREDLEISIAECVHKPTKFYTTWMEEAHKNATTKGHSVIYREKILPALSIYIKRFVRASVHNFFSTRYLTQYYSSGT